MDQWAGTYNYGPCYGAIILLGPVGGDPRASHGFISNCPVGYVLITTGFDQFGPDQQGPLGYYGAYNSFFSCLKV